MQTIRKFNYTPLDRVDGPNGRCYMVNGVALPSVTTILSATSDHTHIDEWKARVGEAKADQIKNEASTLGSNMHNNLENYVLGKPMTGNFLGKTLANVIVKNGLSKVTEIWGTEVALYSDSLYAGTTDLVGEWQYEPTIMDYKNSLRPKKKEQITSYMAQLGAYALAHDSMFGTCIRQGALMIATRDASYQEFVFKGTEFDECIDLWLTALDKYYSMIRNR